MEEVEKGYNAKLDAMQKKLTATKTQVTDLQVKLTAVTTERDAYKDQVAKLKDNKKDLDQALAANAMLMTKLSDAEKQITQFKADNVQKDLLITDLKKEIASVTQAARRREKGERCVSDENVAVAGESADHLGKARPGRHRGDEGERGEKEDDGGKRAAPRDRQAAAHAAGGPRPDDSNWSWRRWPRWRSSRRTCSRASNSSASRS